MTVDVKLPVDKNAVPVQVLSIDDANSSNLSYTGSSANIALPAGVGEGDIVRLAASTDCYISWGFGSADTATSSDPLFTSGVEYFKVPVNASGVVASHISAVQVGSAGVLSVTKAL